jgi:hypothetical protein
VTARERESEREKEREHVLINILPSLIMSSCPSPPFPLQGCHGDGNYEEIEDCPLQFSSGGETTTIYATANLPTSTSDSLNYANVNFHKVPSCPKEATVAIAKEGTSPGYYATVNHPHSTSEAPPIYYTVSKPRDA